MPDEAKQQIIKLLLEKDNFLVSTCEPDKIENIASVLALGLILKKLNKNFLLFVSEMPEMKLDFLPEAESLSSELLSKNLVVFIKE